MRLRPVVLGRLTLAIDLHTHTTASDGTRAPADLPACAARAGVTVLSVTDHDTVAACDAAAAACAAAGIEFVTGIEISAVRDDVDVHVLGYFIDVRAPALSAFLAEQRRRRIERVRKMIDRLEAFGISLDANAIVGPAMAESGRAVGRPAIAQALVSAGHVADAGEAFDRWLQRGRPAFVPRLAVSPDIVIARIHEAGGVASLAHPGLLRRDEWVQDFAAMGLDAVEAYHTEHDPNDTGRYLSLARRLNLAVSGGSDYHGDASHGARAPGSTSLPPAEFDALKSRSSTA